MNLPCDTLCMFTFVVDRCVERLSEEGGHSCEGAKRQTNGVKHLGCYGSPGASPPQPSVTFFLKEAMVQSREI